MAQPNQKLKGRGVQALHSMGGWGGQSRPEKSGKSHVEEGEAENSEHLPSAPFQALVQKQFEEIEGSYLVYNASPS